MARNRLTFREGDIIELEPTGFGTRGAAVAEHEGLRIRVYGGVPGERARVRVTHISKGGPVAEAHFLEPVGDPHPDRREVPCAIHDKCGGCGMQQITEEAALAAKIEQARALLPEGATWEEPIVSPRGFGYRAKTFLLPQRLGRTIRFGARPPRGDRIVDTGGCAVLRPEIESACAVIRRRLGPQMDIVRVLRSILVRGNRRRKVQVTLVHSGPAAGIRAAAETLPFARIFLQQHDAPGNRICSDEPEMPIRAERTVVERFGNHIDAAVPPTAFMQANPDVAAALYAQAAGLFVGTSWAEIYCGSGVAGLMALRENEDARLVGIDRSPRSVAAAKANAEANGLTDRCKFETRAAEDLDQVAWDCVLLNPPRAGCHESVLETVRRSGAQRAIYMSCSAATLARDIDRLGWRVASLRAADMLPQTPHLELLAVLER